MKKAIILLFSLLLLLSLCACADSDQPYTVEKNRRNYTVDPAAGTIADGYEIYHYTFSGNTRDYQFSVTYPDGSKWSWSKKEGMESGGGSADYSSIRYVAGDLLLEMILQEEAPAAPAGNVGLAIFFIAFGGVEVCYPKFFWFLSIGWRIKDAQPTKAALVVRQLAGAALVIIGILIFFPLLFS